MNSEKQSCCFKDVETSHEGNRHNLRTKYHVSVKLKRIEDDVNLVSWIKRNLQTDLDNVTKFHSLSGNDKSINLNKVKKLHSNGKKTYVSTNQTSIKSSSIRRWSALIKNNGDINAKENKQKHVNQSYKKMKKLSVLEKKDLKRNKTELKRKSNTAVKGNIKKGKITKPPYLVKSSNNLGNRNNKKNSTAVLSQNETYEVSGVQVKKRNGCISSFLLDFEKNGNQCSLRIPVNKSDKINTECSNNRCEGQNMPNSIPKKSVSRPWNEIINTEKNLPSSSESLNKFNKNCINEQSSSEEIDVRSDLIELEEPLNLISQLTGCTVAPSKVKVLSLPDSEKLMFCDKNESKTAGLEHENLHLKTEDLVRKSGDTYICCNKEIEIVETENLCNKNIPQIKNGSVKRTIYDLMKEVTLIKPSWNLHVIPGINIFCIGQITTNSEGIPYLSKCIVVDDNFNTKVYVRQQHYEKFDGVYDNEDTLYLLINEVDRYY